MHPRSSILIVVKNILLYYLHNRSSIVVDYSRLQSFYVCYVAPVVRKRCLQPASAAGVRGLHTFIFFEYNFNYHTYRYS